MVLRLACFLMLSAAMLVAGCDRFCTNIGCDTSLTIRTTTPLPKKYTVEIDDLGDRTTVTCDRTKGEPFGVATDADLFVTCDERGVTIAREFPVLTLRFKDGSGAVLGEETLVPDYDERYMNGEECGVTCVQATVEIATIPGLET